MVGAVLESLARATEAAPGWAKAWHNWALYNVSAMEHYAHNDVQAAQRHVAPAVMGFFRSVALAQAHGEHRHALNLSADFEVRWLTWWRHLYQRCRGVWGGEAGEQGRDVLQARQCEAQTCKTSCAC